MSETPQQPPVKRSNWRILGIVVWLTVKWLFIFGVIIGLFAGGALTGYVASLVKSDPVRPRSQIVAKMDENAITGFVYFNDDSTPVGQLRTQEDRRLVALSDIPQPVIDAVLATEDNNFYDHLGVDINGLGRAVKQKLLNENEQTGGSTLTQQLARRVFLSLDVTDARKVKEIFLSLRLERFLTKKEILSAYLNKVPFGNGATGYNLFGVKAAAKGIFNIDLKQLNIAQSAYLAGLPQRPTGYSAFNGKGEFNKQAFGFALERQRFVLKRMLETGRITNQQYDEALKFDIRASLAKPYKKAYSTFPYLMLEAERQAAEILLLQKDPSLTLADLHKKENAQIMQDARESLLRGGYHVYTTIDKKVYNLMRQIGSNPDNFSPPSKEKGIEQIAAIMIDHKTGAILSMLEGRDFYQEQMNYATQMTRQPGSTMKPIAAYLPAIDSGAVQPASILDDAPIVLKDGGKGFHIPKNSNNKYAGLVTAREALNRSLNLPALKVFLNKVGIQNSWTFARKLGITTIQPQDDYAQTGVIGGLSIGVSVEELTNAYSAIPNNGVFNDAYLIRKITDANGKTVYEHKPKPTRVFSEQTAFLMTDMLRTVISSSNGTGHSIASKFKQYGKIPVAGKTGSTQDYGDVWFEGFTPDITLGVWAGYEKQIYTLSKDGRARARTIWTQIMNEVTATRPELFVTKQFNKPDGVVRATVSGLTGKLPTSLTNQTGRFVTDWFNKKYLPKETDNGLVKMTFITYNGINYTAQAGTPSDFVQEKVMFKREKPLNELMDEIKAALAVMPAKNRRPLSFYMPADASLDVPSKQDPRVDDGREPSPPANVRLNGANGASELRIGFSPSPEADVVGYRLYRSVNQGSFQKSGNSLLAGESTLFPRNIAPANSYSFYVTAVDVAGKESARSLIVSSGTDGSASNVSDDTGQPTVEEGRQTNTDGTNTAGETAAPAPSVPTDVAASVSPFGISMSWTANPASEQITRYMIYYSQTINGPYDKIGSSDQAFFELVSGETSGWLRVTAVNATRESEASTPIELK
jgi:penicillin-binding protein